jgi:TrmH family RNA methyltransferase
MEELKKMDRVVKREYPEANFYKLIVLDATTGQNAYNQVEVFNQAVGIDGIILSSNGCDPYSPKALRSSMGTLLRMPVIVCDDFTATLKNSGLSLFACVVLGGKSITDVEFDDGSVVIIGNEANGLTKDVTDIAESITIPMSGRAESLNAAVAAAIAMWELVK